MKLAFTFLSFIFFNSFIAICIPEYSNVATGFTKDVFLELSSPISCIQFIGPSALLRRPTALYLFSTPKMILTKNVFNKKNICRRYVKNTYSTSVIKYMIFFVR